MPEYQNHESFKYALAVVVLPAALAIAYFLVKYGLRFIFSVTMGKFPAFVADRYLFSAKNRNAVNIISFISVLGITVVSAALVVVLSVFNGFQGLIEGMYSSFDPDLKVVAARGKTFQEDPQVLARILSIDEVKHATGAIEEKAMLSSGDKQYMVVVKGVPGDYLAISRLDTLNYEGEYAFETEDGYPMAMVGGSVAYYINAKISDRIHPMKIFAAGDSEKMFKNPEEAVQIRDLFTAAYFSVQIEYDTRYIVTSLDFAKDLFGMEKTLTSYDVSVQDFDKAEEVKEQLVRVLGEDYRVLTWYEQHQSLFDVMKNEKVVAYMILTLMLLIAAVNIVGSLSMIVVEKVGDIAILKAMGASQRLVRRIFLGEGLLVGSIGLLAGMLSALGLGLIHVNYGLLPINGGQSFSRVKYFPFEFNIMDFVLVFFTVYSLTILAAWYPSSKAAQTGIVASLRK